MRGLLTRVSVVLILFVGLSTLGHESAYADTECQVTDPLTGQCTVWVEVPADPGSPGEPGVDGPQDTGSGAACYWDGTSQGITKPPPGPVPCSSPAGYWSNSYRCYISPVEPQPPAGDPSWQGHEPADGAVYNCYQPQTGLLITIWSQDTPPNSGTGPTPREVAQIAIEQMRLSAISIGIAPEPGPDSIGLVGMPVWMWAKDPNAHTIGPLSESASAGGITVTATAKVLQITWDMGDGTEVVCDTAGSPYKPSYGRKDSPDCGHTYTRSSAREVDDAYTVTATSSWVITWSGAGQTGTIRLDGLNNSAQVRIGEAQVLVN
ncbi:hypothetical protein [Nocardioides sp. Soil805]|uniref:hypothetical protein n=1 Tax=Nocardioides sp. Soil805 TaxID=1736416 RepID=UPI0007036024|nr:hypothetical protein [Nocardioides sp. Soil805]KRF32290.1 ATP synthase [Nocardioides sp. Soil805]